MTLKCSVCEKTLERGTAHDRDGRADARYWNPHPPSGWNEHGYEGDTYSPPQPSPTPHAGSDEGESALDEEQADTPSTQGHSPLHDTSAGPDESESPLDEEQDDYVSRRSQADTPSPGVRNEERRAVRDMVMFSPACTPPAQGTLAGF